MWKKRHKLQVMWKTTQLIHTFMHKKITLINNRKPTHTKETKYKVTKNEVLKRELVFPQQLSTLNTLLKTNKCFIHLSTYTNNKNLRLNIYKINETLCV